MNKFQGLGFGFAAIFVLSFVAYQGLALADSRPLVEFETDGDKFSAPVYEDVVYTEDRKKFDREHLAKLFGHFRTMVDSMMVHRRSHFFVAKSAIGVMPTAYNTAKGLKKLQKTDKSPDLAPGYCVKMGDFMFDLIAAKADRPLDTEEARRRVMSLMDGIQGLANNSPVGMYLDWTEFKVNGRPLSEFFAPVTGWFKDNGYGMELKLFEKLASLLKRFSTSDKSFDE